MEKPIGTYITLEAPNMAVPDEGYHREVSGGTGGAFEEAAASQRRLCAGGGSGKPEYHAGRPGSHVPWSNLLDHPAHHPGIWGAGILARIRCR